MPTTQELSKLASSNKLEAFRWTPGATTATAFATRFDMKEFESIGFLVLAASLNGAGGITDIEITGSTVATAGTLVSVKLREDLDADTNGDYVFIEATAEQLGALGDLRYAGLRAKVKHASDVLSVFVIRGEARHAFKGLTSDLID